VEADAEQGRVARGVSSEAVEFPSELSGVVALDRHALLLQIVGAYTGLKHCSVAVADHDAALQFYDDLFEIKVLYQQHRRSISARITGLQLADTIVELLTPTADGVIKQHLDRYGDGMRSVVFGVTDLGQVTRHFAGHGITLVPGDHPDSLAIRLEDNRGVMMEFSGWWSVAGLAWMSRRVSTPLAALLVVERPLRVFLPPRALPGTPIPRRIHQANSTAGH
jgi:catechol 2,3-dioxygenase-like lactoylglutathione lyase family enzyme